MAPVRASIASRSVVLPLWKGPTSAMHRGPRGLLTSCPIAASLFGARPLIGSAALMLRLSRDFGKQENVAALHRDDTGRLTTPTSICRALAGTRRALTPAQAPWWSTGLVRGWIEHHPQRRGKAFDIDAIVPRPLQRNALKDGDHDTGGVSRIEMLRPAPGFALAQSCATTRRQPGKRRRAPRASAAD